MNRRYTFSEATEALRIEQEFLAHCVRSHWVLPADPSGPSLDEQDLARIRLIRALLVEMGVNDEAVPIILHLLDQLISVQGQLKKAG